MTEHLIDLTKIDFWLACLIGLFVLVPLTKELPRKWAWAGVNLGFVALILQLHAVGIVATILVAYLLLRCMTESYRALFATLAACGLGGMFVLHKLPWLADQAGLSPLASTLSVIGFSYIALRMVEVIRAVLEKRHAPPDLPSTINYLIPFHMLAAGPIQSYDEFCAQPPVPKALTNRDVLSAGERIATGLFKKFVLAFLVQKLFLSDFQTGGAYFFVEVQFFFIWLFLDFSAYSDIAVGIGRLLGIATPENFNRPYLARNAIDFWERWHISLSMFIRRNIFIPVQLFLTRRTEGRRPLLCASIAFTIAFLLCGLWHGLTINFFLWGAFHALGLVIANAYRDYLKRKLGARGVKKYLADRRIRCVAQLVTYEFVAFSLVLLFYP
jgi:alginate O-acetyltransferase complex protein AlgI